MSLNAQAGVVLLGAWKAGNAVVLAAIEDEKCAADAPGGGLVESPEFLEVIGFGRGNSIWMQLDSGV